MCVCSMSNFLPMFIYALITFILIWNFSKIKSYLFNNFSKYFLQWSLIFLLVSKGENVKKTIVDNWNFIMNHDKNPLKNIDQVIGKKIKKNLSKNSVLKKNLISS